MADNGLKTDSLQLRISFPFEIVAVIGLRLVRFPYFRKWLILATTNQREWPP